MMKWSAILIPVLLFCSPGFAQDAGQIFFINEIAGKQSVTFGDAVKFYVYALGKYPTNFDGDVKTLRDLKMLKAAKYDKDKKLRRGMLALMIARHLKLKNSLFYLMFDTERYAHRACIGAGFMVPDSSEWDLVSGDELIETMAKVSDRMEERK